MENPRSDRLRILTVSLIFSGALNVGLVLALVFVSIGSQQTVSAPAKIVLQDDQMPMNRQVLSELMDLSFAELLVYLTNRESLEDGYLKRDLALSALTSNHFFYLEKALGLKPIEKRQFQVSSDRTVDLFPGLTDEQFEAVIRYAYQEKWPLAPEGLFHLLKKWPKNGRDPSLCEAFFATPQFYALNALFRKTGAPQDLHVLLDLCLDVSWNVWDDFLKTQGTNPDATLEKRRALLLSCIALGSQTAGKLLLGSDFSYAKTRLSDEQVVSVLNVMTDQSAYLQEFCLDLIKSPRPTFVWRAAGDKLYALAGEQSPGSFEREKILARFIQDPSSPVSEVLAAPHSADASRTFLRKSFAWKDHTVQEGDTLWKIARSYKVQVDDLVRINDLEKDRLFPGMVLRIPQGTGSEPPR